MKIRLFEMLEIKNKDKVLDVGVGHSTIGKRLENVCQFYGIEIDKKKIKSNKFEGLVCGDALLMPFKPKVFTKIICTEVLEHVKNDDLLLCNIWDVLKEDGLLFLTVPREIRFLNFWDPAYAKWKLLDKSYIHRHYSISKLIEKVKRNKFQVMKVVVVYSYFWLLLRWFNVILKYFFKSKKQIKSEINTNRGNFDILLLAKKYISNNKMN